MTTNDTTRIGTETPPGNGKAGQAFSAAPCSASGRIEHFKFDLGERVIIREIQRPGRVEALMIDYLGPQYRVAFWDNSKRESTWLNADELDAR